MVQKSRIHPVDTYIGKKLKVLMKSKRMSQNALGGMLGVSFQQVQKYTNGSNRISCGRLYDIAITMQVPVSFFFIGYDGYTENEKPIFNLDTLEVMSAYQNIPTTHRKELVRDVVMTLSTI